MKQITSRIYEWSQYQPDRQLDHNGHLVLDAPGQPGVLIDPVAPQPGDREHLAALGGVSAVLLTGSSAREAAWFRREFGCPILAPHGSPAASQEAEQPFHPGDRLPAGLEALPVAGAPWDGEVAFFHAPSGALIVGSVVSGAQVGKLSLAAAASADERKAAALARGLRALLAQWVRLVLVAEGDSVLRDAVRALQDLVYQHDPAACLLRRDELVWQPPRERGRRFSRRSAECSRLLGLKSLDFEVTVVPPGKTSTLLHRHDGLEEAFIVLEGEGEVITQAGAFPIQAGDVLGFPPRYQVAHTIRNTGETELRFLAFGAWPDPSEAVGLCEYPNSGKQLQWVPGKSRILYLPDQQHVDYWEGEEID